MSAERDRGFERELEAMGNIKHRNIVTLHGYYTAPHYNLLIYELMPNGNLDQLLEVSCLQQFALIFTLIIQVLQISNHKNLPKFHNEYV